MKHWRCSGCASARAPGHSIKVREAQDPRDQEPGLGEEMVPSSDHHPVCYSHHWDTSYHQNMAILKAIHGIKMESSIGYAEESMESIQYFPMAISSGITNITAKYPTLPKTQTAQTNAG